MVKSRDLANHLNTGHFHKQAFLSLVFRPPFEYQTIWQPNTNLPFEYQTRLVFRWLLYKLEFPDTINKIHWEVEPKWQSPQFKSGYKPQAVPAHKLIVGLHQARVAHHHVYGPDTGSNSRGRQITKKISTVRFLIALEWLDNPGSLLSMFWKISQCLVGLKVRLS